MSSSMGQDLLDRYLAGECSAADAAEVERWLEAGPENRRLLGALRRAAGPPDTAVRVDVDAAWSRMHERLREPARGEPHPRLAARRRGVLASGWGLGLRAAAVLLLLLGPVWLWGRLRAPGSTAAAALEVVRTEPGERRTVRLPDGSEVVLSVDSRLRYEPDLRGAARDVFLEGEAYFRVAHDAERPFRVHAANAVTQVLGTEFAVHAYPGEAQVRVVVAEGRVLLRPADAGPDAGAVLGRGDLGRLSPQGISVLPGTELERYLGWMRGHLVLEDVPLAEAARQLERWYGVELRVRGAELANRRVTLLLRGESLEQAVETLVLMLDLEYERRADVIVLFPRGGA